MAFKFADLLPTSVREQWNAAKNKTRLKDPPPPSTLADLLYRSTVSAQNAFKQSTAEAALATGEGQSFRQEAERVTISQYLQNPILWIVAGVFIFYIFGKK